MTDFNIGFVIFPGITQLDFTGPFEVLSRLATPPSMSVEAAPALMVHRNEKAREGIRRRLAGVGTRLR
jgi:hypothetical protein